MEPKEMERKLQAEIEELEEIQKDLFDQDQEYVRRALGLEEDE